MSVCVSVCVCVCACGSVCASSTWPRDRAHTLAMGSFAAYAVCVTLAAQCPSPGQRPRLRALCTHGHSDGRARGGGADQGVEKAKMCVGVGGGAVALTLSPFLDGDAWLQLHGRMHATPIRVLSQLGMSLTDTNLTV